MVTDPKSRASLTDALLTGSSPIHLTTEHLEANDRMDFSRNTPAPETELLNTEPPGISPQLHVRVLAMLEARVGEEVSSVPPHMLKEQSFDGVSFVGITASIHGLHGLHAQSGWFESDAFDWFWVEITDVRKIELRRDSRFRGGTPCLWMTTGFAEYAMVTSHTTYDENWERTLERFGAPRCDIWPRRGLRPHWWPAQWAGSWPYDRSIPEQYAALMQADPLAQLAQKLSLASDPVRPAWRRLGPKGDPPLPGRPANHLSQLSQWILAPDAGMRKTRDTPAPSAKEKAKEKAKEEDEDEDAEEVDRSGGKGKGTGKRRRPAQQRASKSKRRRADR